MAYFQYPASTLFENRLSKEVLYQKIALTPALKRAFVDDIQSIEWRYKLAESTINLEASETIQEVQVFQIKLKQDFYDPEILRAIDTAIPYPIIFEIISKSGITITSAHKRPKANGSGMIVDKTYFKSPCFPLDQPRKQLPPAISLEALYHAIFKQLMPADIVPNDSDDLSVEALIEKNSETEKLQREIKRLKTRIRNEKQFNKKFELNAQLKDLESAL